MVDIILVEEDLTESALACIAIALRRPGTKVLEARSLGEARRLLAAGSPALVVLGWTALRNGLEAFFEALHGRANVVGLAANLGKDGLERAARLGVKRVYHKPVEWKAYVGVVERLMVDWLGRHIVCSACAMAVDDRRSVERRQLQRRSGAALDFTGLASFGEIAGRAEEIIGYEIEASDGPIGPAADFCVEGEGSVVTGLLAAPDSTATRIFVPLSAIERIDQGAKRIYVGLSRDAVARGTRRESRSAE